MEEKGLFPPVLSGHSDDDRRAAGSQERVPGPMEEGPPLPDGYDIDMVRMLVQDPYRIYVFWELSEAGADRARRRAGQLGLRDGALALQVTRLSDQSTMAFPVGVAREWWLMAEPDTGYLAEIGMSFGEHFFTIATSNRVRTPRVVLAEFEPVPVGTPAEEERSEEVLRASGFRPVTVESVREQLQPGEREPTPRERTFLDMLPADARAMLLEPTPDLPPAALKRVLWAVPRFTTMGSERGSQAENLLESISWPFQPTGWPSSNPR